VSLAERRGLRLFTFCVLYVAQGIPWGFTAITLPAYLAAHGLTTDAVATALAVTVLPYTFKIFWGPIVDAFPSRRFGRRRPWIIGAQLMMAVTIGTMILIPDLTRDLDLLVAMVFVHTIFNSLQDIATDALAVDLLDEDERGRTNGLMYGSKYFGGILGGAGMSTLIAWQSMRFALVAQTITLLAIMLVPMLVRERPRDAEVPRIPLAVLGRKLRSWFERTEFRREVRRLVRSAGVHAALLGGLAMLLSNVAGGLLTAVAPVLFTQDLGWDFEHYTQLVGGPGLAAGLAGSVIGGFLADLVGHRRLAVIGAASLGAFWIVWAALASHWSSKPLVYALVGIEPLFQSLTTVSLFAICMDLSWPKIGATQFGIYMALANASTLVGFKLAGHAATWWTYPGIYIAAAAMQVLVVVVVRLVDPNAVRRALSETAPA
jgi:MFS transporter, PAT family, beta-lactamase induction signal transducer AmpG